MVILVVGSTVVLIGLALIVLPGPAFVVIPAGLAILATEFVWARLLLDRVKRGVKGLPGIRNVYPGKAAPDQAASGQAAPPEGHGNESCMPTDQNSRK
jgi:hypothetical protein